MLGSIMGACKGCITTPESDFFLDFIFETFNKKHKVVDSEKVVDFFSNHYRFRQWNIEAKDIISGDEKITYSNFHVLMEESVRLYAKTHFDFAEKEFTRIDHTPKSILHFSVLNRLFPVSKLVFIIRDPRAIFASIKDLDWGPNTPLGLSNLWIEYAASYYAVQKLHPDRIYLVRYEDLVSEPSTFIGKVCSFAGLEYNEKILEGGGLIVPKYTASQHRLVGKKPSKERINKWKSTLSHKEILTIESKCDTIMRSFGYESIIEEPHKVKMKNQIFSLVQESYRYIVNRIKKAKRQKIGG